MATHPSADERLTKHVDRWVRKPPPTIFRSPTLAESVFWAIAAAGSGIIGSASYDALKAAYEKLRRRGQQLPTRNYDEHMQSLALLARLAVQARCAEVGFPIPEVTSLECEVDRVDPTGALVQLKSANLSAEVFIPDGTLDGKEITVILRRANPS